MTLFGLPAMLVPLRKTSRTITRKKFGDRAKTTHQVVANVAQTGPKTSSMQLKSQCLSELGSHLTGDLPSTFEESGSLRRPPVRRIMKANTMKNERARRRG